jgi:hypothetical protein
MNKTVLNCHGEPCIAFDDNVGEELADLVKVLTPKPVPLTRADVEAAVQWAAAEYLRLKGTKVQQ